MEYFQLQVWGLKGIGLGNSQLQTSRRVLERCWVAKHTRALEERIPLPKRIGMNPD